jgi:hypothetical protein
MLNLKSNNRVSLKLELGHSFHRGEVANPNFKFPIATAPSNAFHDPE